MKIEVDLITYILLWLVLLKNILIGGSFSIHLWMKYGKDYSNWFYSLDYEKTLENK